MPLYNLHLMAHWTTREVLQFYFSISTNCHFLFSAHVLRAMWFRIFENKMLFISNSQNSLLSILALVPIEEGSLHFTAPSAFSTTPFCQMRGLEFIPPSICLFPKTPVLRWVVLQVEFQQEQVPSVSKAAIPQLCYIFLGPGYNFPWFTYAHGNTEWDAFFNPLCFLSPSSWSFWFRIILYVIRDLFQVLSSIGKWIAYTMVFLCGHKVFLRYISAICLTGDPSVTVFCVFVDIISGSSHFQHCMKESEIVVADSLWPLWL